MCYLYIFFLLCFEILSYFFYLKFKKKINFFVLNVLNFIKIIIFYLKGLILDGIIIF